MVSKEITPAYYLGILSLPCEYLITVLSQLDLYTEYTVSQYIIINPFTPNNA